MGILELTPLRNEEKSLDELLEELDRRCTEGGAPPRDPDCAVAFGTPGCAAGFVSGCAQCEANRKGDHGPSHAGSQFCESGAIAAGGERSHCTCDCCF